MFFPDEPGGMVEPGKSIGRVTQAPNAQQLVRGKKAARLRPSGRKLLPSRRQALTAALATQKREHFEEARTYRLSCNSYTDGVNEQRRFHSVRVGDTSDRAFSRRDVERLQLREGRVNRQEPRRVVLAL